MWLLLLDRRCSFLGLTPSVAEDAIGAGDDLERHALIAVITLKAADLQLAVHKELGALLDVVHTLGQLAKAAHREVCRLILAVAHGQTKVAVRVSALLGLFDLAVTRGVTDKVYCDFLIVQISSPPPVRIIAF